MPEYHRNTEEMDVLLEKIDLSQPAPTEEPMRQYYFIKKAKEYVKKAEETVGRPLTACITTFGCQMNARDSEKLAGILEQIGYQETEDEEHADFVIFNTCTAVSYTHLDVYKRQTWI